VISLLLRHKGIESQKLTILIQDFEILIALTKKIRKKGWYSFCSNINV